MALTTARISSARWRPPSFGGGIRFLIRSHSASVRSVGYGLAFISRVYCTDATYRRLFKQPLRAYLSNQAVSQRTTSYVPKKFVGLQPLTYVYQASLHFSQARGSSAGSCSRMASA